MKTLLVLLGAESAACAASLAFVSESSLATWIFYGTAIFIACALVALIGKKRK